MVAIQILQGIKHNGQQFHAGELRMVDEMLAGYFCGNGWAKEPNCDAAIPDTTAKTLEVQNGQHGHAAKNLGVK